MSRPTFKRVRRWAVLLDVPMKTALRRWRKANRVRRGKRFDRAGRPL